MSAKPLDTPGVLPPPLIPTTALVLAGLLEWLAPLGLLPAFGWFGPLFWAGAVATAFGLAWAGWAALTLYLAGTPVEPWHPTLVLVRSGPFRLGRNPIYLSFLVAIGGLSLALSLDWGLVSLPFAWLALDRLIIAREERYLSAKFGSDYEDFRASTRRWL